MQSHADIDLQYTRLITLEGGGGGGESNVFIIDLFPGHYRA